MTTQLIAFALILLVILVYAGATRRHRLIWLAGIGLTIVIVLMAILILAVPEAL